MSWTLTTALRAACMVAVVGPRPFCRPPIPPGPSAVQLAQEPVRITVRDAPAGTTELWVRAGYALDPPGFEGLAYATAHALTDGTVDVDAEWLRFTTSCADTACVVAWAQAIVDGPTQARVDAATESAHRVLGAPHPPSELAAVWVFEGHPYGHLPAGRHGSLQALTLPQLTQFHREHYVRATAHVVVDSEALASALTPVLGELGSSLPVDFPLQQPEPVTSPRALLVDADTPRAAAAVAIPAAVLEDVAAALPAAEPDVTMALVGGPDAEFPRRQAHLEVTASGKTAHYAARRLQAVLRGLRCDPVLDSVLQNPSVVIAASDPEVAMQRLGEEVPYSHVYCSDEAEPSVTLLDLPNAVIIDSEDLFP